MGGSAIHLRHTQVSYRTPSIEAQIAGIAARRHALVTFAQLLSLGLTDGTISRRVARGLLHRRHRGVYVVGQPKLSGEGEWIAAVLAAGEDAALSHISSAQLHGTTRHRSPLIAVLSVHRRRIQGVRLYTTRRLDRRDVTSHHGIPVTTVHRTLVDLSDVLTPHQLVNVIHEAAYRGRFVETAVRDSMARASGRHNLHVLERAIGLHRAGSAGTRSGAEDAFRALMADEPLVTTDLHGIEVDFHWPARKLVVEVDGPHHTRPRTRRDDARRDRTLRAAGFRVVRFTDEEVHQRPAAVQAAVEELLPADGVASLS